jgi:DNA-binding response OmpR family regulator
MTRLLIVDDEDTIRAAMHEYFTLRGFGVDTAADPLQARALLVGGRYGMLVADLSLTGARSNEGLDLASFARQCTPEIRICLLTARPTGEIRRVAAETGVDVVLVKPQPLPRLAQVIYALTGSRA